VEGDENSWAQNHAGRQRRVQKAPNQQNTKKRRQCRRGNERKVGPGRGRGSVTKKKKKQGPDKSPAVKTGRKSTVTRENRNSKEIARKTDRQGPRQSSAKAKERPLKKKKDPSSQGGTDHSVKGVVSTRKNQGFKRGRRKEIGRSTSTQEQKERVSTARGK